MDELDPQERWMVEGILDAYRRGAFPMADPPRWRGWGRDRRWEEGPIRWYSPDPRAILPLEAGGFHVSRSLRRRVRSGRFRVTSDAAFERVIRACAEPRPGREESWIDERIVSAYTVLHRAGHAHSVEAWMGEGGGEGVEGGEGVLVGGVYGVRVGGVFCAESMFSRPELGGTDASKVCLAHLVSHLRRRGFALLDVQMRNPHTDQFGVVEIPREEYLARLAVEAEREVGWGSFEPDVGAMLL